MYKKILVPLDGSEFGECSLGQIKQFVSADVAPEVILLGVVEPILEAGILASHLGSDWLVAARKKMDEGTGEYLASAAKKLKDIGITAKTVTVQGNAAEEILRYVTENGIELIVISTHGRSGVVKWALGGVADKVARQSVIPVLLVAPKACRNM